MNLRKYIDDIITEFQKLKSTAEKAMVQLDDKHFFKLIDPDANSVAIIVKHLNGNLRSRWTDFLTSDGEKPDRYRDTEFDLTDNDTREYLMKRWEQYWTVLFETLKQLQPDDLDQEITIRNQKMKVYSALTRQLTHYAAHVGQIIMLAKHLRGKNWQTLSIAKGKTEEYYQSLQQPDTPKYFKESDKD